MLKKESLLSLWIAQSWYLPALPVTGQPSASVLPKGIWGREGQKWGQTDVMEVERKEHRDVDEIVTERKGSHVEKRKKERG